MEFPSINNSTTVPQAVAAARAAIPPPVEGNDNPASRPDEAALAAQSTAALSPTGKPEANGKDQKEQLAEAVDNINNSLKNLQNQSSALEFTVDKDLGRVIVRLVDTKTHEVIRQYPAEEVLEIARQMDKLVGKLLKDKA